MGFFFFFRAFLFNRYLLSCFFLTKLMENPSIRTTETRFYEPARLSTPSKPLRSLLPKVFQVIVLSAVELTPHHVFS